MYPLREGIYHGYRDCECSLWVILLEHGNRVVERAFEFKGGLASGVRDVRATAVEELV